MRNLDRDPRLWMTVAILLPLMIAAEVACRVEDAIDRRRRASR